MFALPCLLFQADCFVRGLTLRSNNDVENLCMRPNTGPAAAGPVATALIAIHMLSHEAVNVDVLPFTLLKLTLQSCSV